MRKVSGQRVGPLAQQVGRHPGVAVLAGQHQGREALVAALVEHGGQQAAPLDGGGGGHAGGGATALARHLLSIAYPLLQWFDDGAACCQVARSCSVGVALGGS